MGVDAQMLVKTRRPVTEDEVRSRAADLHERFGSIVSVNHPHSRYGWEPFQHCLEIVAEYEQDGHSIVPTAGETLIEVHLRGRYYGVGYERGFLQDYIAVADALETWFAPCEVWYGGDSSGICAEPFGPSARHALWKYFLDNGHVPYHGYFERGVGPKCSFCLDRPMVNHGGGRDKDFWSCHGCGAHWVTTPTSCEPADDDFQPLSRQKIST